MLKQIIEYDLDLLGYLDPPTMAEGYSQCIDKAIFSSLSLIGPNSYTHQSRRPMNSELDFIFLFKFKL